MEEENKFSTSSVSGGILLIVIFLVLLVMAFYDSSLQQKKTHPPSNASTSNPFKEPLIPINPSDLKAPTDRQTPEKYQGSNDSTKTALSSEPTLDVALEKNPPISSHRQLEQFIGNLPPASTSQNSQQNLKPISQENSSQKKDPPESSKNTPPVPPQQVRGGKDERFQPLEKKKEIILPELLQAQAVSEELAQKSYAMDLDEVHLERDSQEKVGEVEGRSYTKAQYKAFLKEFLGQSYIDTYLFYLRCRRALRDLQVELDPQKVQETAGESLKKFIQNPTNQKMYQDLGLSQKTFESWYRRQAFLEESLQKLFEKREVSEKTVREKFESQFGEKGIHYDIKQIMLVRYNKQSKFYPESQYQEELQNGKVEESLQKWGTQLLAELQQNPAQWNDFLRKKSDEAQKLRTQGRLQFTPEAFGEAVYQAVLQLQPGQFYGPVKTSEGSHILRLDQIRPQEEFKFIGAFFPQRGNTPEDREEAKTLAHELVKTIQQTSQASEKDKILREAAKNNSTPLTAFTSEPSFISYRHFPQLFEAAKKMQKLQYSGVLEDTSGFWVIQLLDFRSVPEVSHLLLSKEYNLFKQRWLDEHFETLAPPKIQEIAQKLEAGEPWESLWETYNENPRKHENGVYKTIRVGNYGKEFLDALKNMQVGERRILKLPHGISLVELYQVNQASFEENWKDFFNKIRPQNRRQAAVQYVNEHYPLEQSPEGSLSIKGERVDLEKYYEYLSYITYFSSLRNFLQLEVLKQRAGNYLPHEKNVEAHLNIKMAEFLQKQFQGNKEIFNLWLKNNGIQEKDFKLRFKYEAYQKDLASYIAQRVRFSEQELHEEFQRQFGQLAKDSSGQIVAVQHEIQHLFIATDPLSSQKILPQEFKQNRDLFEKERLKEAQDLMEKLKTASLTDFENAVQQYSEDLKLKASKGYSDGKGFEEELQKIQKGEHTVVSRPEGIYLLRRLPNLRTEMYAKRILRRLEYGAGEEEIEEKREEMLEIKKELESQNLVGDAFYQAFGEMAKKKSNDVMSRSRDGLFQSPLTRLEENIREACLEAADKNLFYTILGPLQSQFGWELLMVEKIEEELQMISIFLELSLPTYKKSRLQNSLQAKVAQEIQEAKNALDQGASFKEVAHKYSELHPNQFRTLYNGSQYGSEFAQALLQLKEGELSPILHSPQGMHLVKILQIQKFPYEQYRPQILQKIQQNAFTEPQKDQILLKEYYKAGLKAFPLLWHQE